MAVKIKLVAHSDPFTYFSPRRAIEETLYYLMERADELSPTSLKQVTEICNAAIFALGNTLQDGEERWVRNPLKIENTPDAYIMSLGLRDNGQSRVVQEHEVEIVTLEAHSEDEIVDFLRRTKLSPKKKYSANSTILCRIDKETFVGSWKEIHTKLMPIMNGLQVHFLFRVKESPSAFQIVWMGQTDDLFLVGEEFNLVDALEKDAKDLIRFQKRTGLDMSMVEIDPISMFSET